MSRNATNLITAMPRLAASAAKTALMARNDTHGRPLINSGYSIRAWRSVIAAVWLGSIPEAMARYTLA